MQNERFRRSWTGRITSSAGYSVRVGSRTGVDYYRDESRRLRIDSELMVRSSGEILIMASSIPDGDGSRGLVLARVVRALAFDGLSVVVVTA
jgi:hypothetical protein